MTGFAIAVARGDSVIDLVQNCVGQLRGAAEDHTLGFVYATDPLSDSYADLVETLRRSTGIMTWIGTVGFGIVAGGEEIFGTPAVAVMTCAAPPSSFDTISAAAPGSLASALRPDAVIGIVHADPRNHAVSEIVEDLSTRQGAYLVGGLTSGESALPQADGSNVSDGGASGIVLGGSSMSASVGLTQGCSPIGSTHRITSCEGQVIASLDGRPAFEVLREDAGASETDNPRRWLADIHVALPVPGSDRADYVVRNLIGLDIEAGLIAIGANVSEGDPLLFVRRDRAAAERDMLRMLADVKSRTRSPKAALYFSCLARGPNLFREPNYEIAAIRSTFGDIPVVGFFGNGEIANDRVYGYTGVLTLFS